MLPTITVVTPSYNQGDFIEQTISSVLSQNYPRLQYIVIDGGSTDCSRAVISRYSDKIDYWISEKDGGQSDALRKGFSLATGELLGWLNSDDILYPGALQLIGEAYESNSRHLIAGNVAVFTEGKSRKSWIIRQRHLNVRDMVAGWTGRACYSQPGVFFSHDAYIQSGGIDVSLNWGMDRDLMIRLLRNCPVTYLNEIVAGARLHPMSKTCSQAGNEVAELYSVYRRYWAELPYSTTVCRFLSLLGLGRRAIGRLYHCDPVALGPIILKMMNMALGSNKGYQCR
jgi:glycosyltransferase involved in cell wall biosynthesis